MTIKKGLAARATIDKGNGVVLEIDVKEGEMFSSFFSVSLVTRQGRKRVVTPSIPRPRSFADDLENAARQIATSIQLRTKGAPVVTKVKVYRKRLYKKLLAKSPDELGLAKVRPIPQFNPNPNRRAPEGYVSLDQRWKIMTKRR